MLFFIQGHCLNINSFVEVVFIQAFIKNVKPIFLLLWLLFFVSLLQGQPEPCMEPPRMTSTCAEACIICDIDGFTGRHQSNTVGQAPPGFAGQCTFVAHNMQWIAFIAGSEDLEIKMSISNCRDGIGLEFGLYESTDCQNFKRISNCFGGAAGIINPGGSGVIKNFEPLVIGQYYYIVMDGALGDNCDWTFEVLKGDTRVDPLDTSGPINGNFTTCPEIENLYTVDAPVGATEFEWTLDGVPLDTNNDSILINYNQGGVYSLCVVSSNACNEAPSTCQTVFVSPIPTTILEEKICADEAYEIEGQILNETGVYEFPLFSRIGCDSLVILDLEVVVVPELNLDLDICEGDSIFIGGNPYFQTGVYQERLLTELGCDSIINLDLFEVICEIRTSAQVNPVVCHGENTGSINFLVERGTPPFTYEWSKIDNPAISGTGVISNLNEEQTINTLTQGTYGITILDNFGNTSILFEDVPEPSPLTGSFETIDRNGFNVSCFGENDGELRAIPAGGVNPFSFRWENGSLSDRLTNLSAGNYIVSITDSVGCETILDYTLTSPVPITFESIGIDPGCEGINTGSISVENIMGGSPSFTYQLDDGLERTTNVFENMGPGTYQLTVMDANGCSSRDTLSLVAPEIPNIRFIDPIELNLGDSLLLRVITNNIDIAKVEWDTAYGLSCSDCLMPYLRPLDNIEYTVSVSSIDGCSDTISFNVNVVKLRRVYAPNIFSPNGDGANDFFKLSGGPEVSNIARLVIFDRWGSLVFEGYDLDFRDPQSGWDGKFNGALASPGVYIWQAQIQYIDDISETLSGDLTLVR